MQDLWFFYNSKRPLSYVISKLYLFDIIFRQIQSGETVPLTYLNEIYSDLQKKSICNIWTAWKLAGNSNISMNSKHDRKSLKGQSHETLTWIFPSRLAGLVSDRFDNWYWIGLISFFKFINLFFSNHFFL